MFLCSRIENAVFFLKINVLFKTKGDKFRTKGDKFRTKGDKFRTKGDKFRSEQKQNPQACGDK
jgi:hypothetical protein